MAPLRTILWTALLTGTGASDISSLLQRKVSAASIRKESAQVKGLHLLETAQTLIGKVNAGDDPTQCGIVSDTIRAAVEEAIPAIFEQHTHHQNEIDSAAQAVEECPFQGDDLVQEGNNLNALRQDHATCRMAEQGLQDGLQPCHQYEQLRSSGYSCPAFPNDESGYPDALQRARDELELHFNEAVALRDACNAARDALARNQEECASAQSTFEGAFCAHRLNCAGAQACRTTTEDAYNRIRSEVEAASASLESEYELFKHVECLLGHADDALAQQSIVAGDEVAACSDVSQIITAEERERLNINYPTLPPLISCDDSVILQPPCEANFFEAEYAGLPQREAIQAACTSCPPLPGSEVAPPVSITTPPPTPGWTLILQYGLEGTYTPTSDAVGVPSENEAGFAKLSDADINAIPSGGDAAYNYYRLTSDGENPSILLRTPSTTPYDDTAHSPFHHASACGSAPPVAAHVDQCASWQAVCFSCTYFDVFNTPNACDRWFQGVSSQCYKPHSLEHRCYSHGQVCSKYGQGDHPPRRNVKIYKFTAQ